MLGYIFVGKLAKGFVLAPRMLAKNRELGRFDRRRDADALRPSRLRSPGGRPAFFGAFGLVVIRPHRKAFERNRQRRRRV